ncbi:hypothetical protein Fmac_014107 [Flemingia macrophylla]|uniref:Transmembrane protein n=1 Tax=Flemingia macrophylla TaxID=520843 RepID=A0ABD1MAU3_9FABA
MPTKCHCHEKMKRNISHRRHQYPSPFHPVHVSKPSPFHPAHVSKPSVALYIYIRKLVFLSNSNHYLSCFLSYTLLSFFTMNSHIVYFTLMGIELTIIGIKYGGSGTTNPFQQSTPSPTVLLVLTALFSHVLASAGDMLDNNTIITFHVSGIVGCETLLWIILSDQFLWYFIIINLLFLLIASFCFFNYVTRLQLAPSFNNSTAPATPANAPQVPNIQQQP